jgi:sugar-specific transcriptional regulator TrmB
MIDFEHIKNELEKVGLSKNQAEIYLLLVNRGALRVQEIVQLSGVARSSVYESLKKLYELGIAEEVIDKNFKKIKPYPIGIIKHGLDDQVSYLQKLQVDLADLEKNIKIASAANTAGSTTIRYYKGRSGARQIFWNSLKAKSTAYIYSDYGRARYVGMRFYENFVAESYKRNIKEKVMMNMEPATWESIKRFNYTGSPIARTRVEDIRFLDKKDFIIRGDTLIYDNIYAQVYLKNVEINGFEIESSQFADSQRAFYKILWRMAQSLPPTLSETEKESIKFEGIDDPHVGKLPSSASSN